MAGSPFGKAHSAPYSSKRLETARSEWAIRETTTRGCEALDRAIARHGKPQTITVDHGTEFTCACATSGHTNGVLLDFTRPR
jgi:hypothetical protein